MQRTEIVFELAGDEYRRRPTFASIAAIEAAYGPVVKLLQRIAQSEIGLSDTAALVHLILGGPEKGAPKRSVVQEAVFDDGFITHLGRVAEFLAAAISTGEERPAEEADGGATEAARPSKRTPASH